MLLRVRGSTKMAPTPIAGCVNDLSEVERRFPDARLWIEEAISR